jgi:lipoprotein-anchoring transpeptidase ErfK/SrfK
MPDRRRFLFSGAAALAASAALPSAVMAQTVVRIPRSYLPTEVSVNPELEAGQIHVLTSKHNLFWTLGEGRAIRYTVALGAEGRQFTGSAVIRRKAEWPSWRPTESMIRFEPEIYGPYRAGLPGGHERNPMGARGLYLYQDGRDTLYRIHGTPQPWTIGQSFSSGCIRLMNDHIEDLYARVPLGTRVFVQ